MLSPLSRYLPSADADPSSFEPVVLKMQPRDNEQRRVISGRKVLLRQIKQGRFDLKPTTDRVESEVDQTAVPITVERMPDNVIKVSATENLKRGEYALVFRKKVLSGAYTTDVALKPTPGMSPDQMRAMQQAQGQQSRPRGGMFRMGRSGAAAQSAPAGGGVTAGFLAWDSRVMP